MPATNIDYANTYFEYPELSKIHGTPTYPLICIIKDEIKAHAVAPHMTSHIRHKYTSLLLLTADNILYTMAPYSRIHYQSMGHSTL